MSKHNVIQHFINQAGLYPDSIAIEMGDAKVSYAELMIRSAALQNSFKLQGVEIGHKMLILHPLSIDLYAGMLALLSMGVTLVFAEEWTGISDISACQQHMACDALICSTKVSIITFFYRELRKMKRIHLTKKQDEKNITLIPGTPEINQAALISFSSGSSGTSKAVIRTHEQLNAQFDALKEHIPLMPGQLICTNFPVVILLNLGLGLRTYISSSIRISKLEKTNFESLYDEIDRHKIVCLACSPFIVNGLAEFMIRTRKPTLPLAHILSGGSPFFPAYADNIAGALPATALRVLYGSSEAEPIAFCDAKDIILNRNKPGLFAGSIDTHTSCKIGKMHKGHFIENEAGIAGEIIVSGTHVVTGYYQSPAALAQNKLLMDGRIWHRTGDYGYFDEQRQLFLTGDPAYTLASSYLLETEKVLAEIPGIIRATLLSDFVYILKQPFSSKKPITMHVVEKFPNIQRIKFLKLPLDKRHYGKIKYRLLK